MALLFTVVLSASPSRISQSHNPLFIPTEAQSVCKWTWVMADKERLTSPPIPANHAAPSTWAEHIWEHAHSGDDIDTNAHRHTTTKSKHKEWRRKEREQMKKGFIFSWILPSFLSVLSAILCHVTL